MLPILPASRRGTTLNLRRQQIRVFLEPAFRLAVVRAEAGHFRPKPPGMVHFPEVRQFMQHEVIADPGWCLHQAPVEGDGAAGRTGAPARALAADGHAPHGQMMPGGQFAHARRKFERSLRVVTMDQLL